MMTFKINGVSFNSKIYNRPTVEISTQGEWDINSIEGSSINLSLLVADEPSAGDRLTVYIGTTLIWSGDYDITSFRRNYKTGLINVTFLPDMVKLKDLLLTYSGTSIGALFTEINSVLSSSGMSLDKNFGSNGLTVGGNDANLSLPCYSPMQCWEWSDPADGRTDLFIAGNAGGFTVYHHFDYDGSYLESVTSLPSGVYSVYASNQQVPYPPGILEGLSGPGGAIYYNDGSDNLRKWTYVDAAGNRNGIQIDITSLSYDDTPISDVLKDILILTNSYINVLNDVIYMRQNIINTSADATADILEKKETRYINNIKELTFSGVTLPTGSNSTSERLLKYYQGMYREIVRYELKYIGDYFSPGENKISLAGTNYGILRSVSITNGKSIIQARTDVPGNYGWVE